MNTQICGLAIVVAALSGCTGSTNPADAGLFDNIRNLESGEYDRQIASKEAEAAAVMLANASITADNSAKQARTQANTAQIAQFQAAIRSLRAESSSIRSRVAGDPVRISQLDRLDGQIMAVEADLAGGGDPSALTGEMRRLRSAIRALAN